MIELYIFAGAIAALAIAGVIGGLIALIIETVDWFDRWL